MSSELTKLVGEHGLDHSQSQQSLSPKTKDFIKCEIQKHSTKKKENRYTTPLPIGALTGASGMPLTKNATNSECHMHKS